jgi:large subunit ribosomal protein L25
MSDQATTTVSLRRRTAVGSRAARRLRRSGVVPGVLYGAGREALAVEIGVRELRHLLTEEATVLEVELEGDRSPAVIKEVQRDPVKGDPIHIDLMRVQLDRPIHAVVPLELVGGEEAPGVKEGGILEQIIREVTVEGLPTAIPAALEVDVSKLGIGDNLTVADLIAPAGVKVLTETPDAIVATITPPRLPGGGGGGAAAEGEAGGEEG